ncbi:hypothetical protein BKA61DRAFT_106385 [Leptodontidium sp. MPI-SDFR-AT-0119]|nr:hypothetical protein BKA61DRAFT_106385 [Leptodontidium sp. MPI-SDFR-AT-0119]
MATLRQPDVRKPGASRCVSRSEAVDIQSNINQDLYDTPRSPQTQYGAPILRPLPPISPTPWAAAGDVRRRTSRATVETPPSPKANAKASQKKQTGVVHSAQGADKDESDSDEDRKRNRNGPEGEVDPDEFRQIPKSRRPAAAMSTATVVEESPEALSEALVTELIANWHGFQIHRSEHKSENAARELVLLTLENGAISSSSSSRAKEQFSEMLSKILSEDLETVNFAEGIVAPYIDGKLTDAESKRAVEDLLVEVETAVVNTLGTSPFFVLATGPDTASGLDTHDFLLKILRLMHTDDAFAAEADVALGDLIRGMGPSLLLEYLAKMRDIPKLTGVFPGGELWNAYEHWRRTKFPGFSMGAIQAAENKKRVEIIGKTEYTFVPRSMARVRILVFSGERLVCEKTIPVATMKKLGWHRHSSWIKRPADEWYWRYRVGTSEGNESYIFKEQMDGKVIGLWSPDGDIDWDAEHEKALQEAGGLELDSRKSD